MPISSKDLLDNSLSLLPDRIDRGLVDDLQALAVFDPHTITAPLPSSLIQERCGLFRIKLPGGVRRYEARRGHEEITRRLAGWPIKLFRHSPTIHSFGIGFAEERIGLERMRFFDTTAFAFDFGPWIGEVHLNMLNT